MRGTSGCNFYGSFDARAEDGAFEAGRPDLTTIGCRGPIERQESAYLRALGASRAYRLEDDRLELRDQSNRTTLLFEKEAR